MYMLIRVVIVILINGLILKRVKRIISFLSGNYALDGLIMIKRRGWVILLDLLCNGLDNRFDVI